jgi:hypothetical protein
MVTEERRRARTGRAAACRRRLCGSACLGLPELRLQLLDLGVRIFLVLFAARLAQLLARLSLGFVLRLLRRCDLRFDFDDGGPVSRF